ncbi:hypothetical protein HID58_032102 [Brassica napus]|uniref:F-box associated beta-propeller type 1 domain-containing protein n=1 Tax=Brassica napus TaxID=3708 RepID=A0ABQ8BX76_BRANA|nr:hypothetical protein HID58_032102 [Brassica napus]
MHIDKLSEIREGESMMVAWIDYDLYLMRVLLVDNRSNRRVESYALGYEDKGSCRSYKFLRFIDRYVDYATRDEFLWYEIYDFDSSSWKTLDVTPHWRIQFCHGVCLKGNTYWPASQRKREGDVLNDHIICFDFTSESFGPLLRLPFDAGYCDYVTLSCVREEKLAVLLTHNEAGPMEFEIWITTKIEAENVLWSKFLRVLEPDLAPLITCNGFFVEEENKVAMVIDLLPGTPYNQQISNCCKGGVLKPGLASSFQISVGAAGTSNSTVRMAVNFMFTAPKQQYICGPTKNVMRTKFITSDSKRTTSALMTWNIACVFHKAT